MSIHYTHITSKSPLTLRGDFGTLPLKIRRGEKRILGALQDSLRFFAKKSNEWTEPVRLGVIFFLLFFLLLPLTSHASVLSRAPNNLGLVGYWSFNEGSGNVANDSSGNGNNGTISGASWVAGKVGSGALNFDGSNDYINLNSPDSLDNIQTTGSGLTASMWVNLGAYTGNQPFLIGKGGINSSGFWFLFLDSSGPTIRFNKDFGTAGWNADDLEVRASFPDTYLNNWKHIVLTWDGSSSASGVHIYIDSSEISKSTATNGTGSAVSDASLNLRVGYNDSGVYIHGGVDEVRIYNRALSATEIQKLYKSGSAKVAASSADLDNGGTLDSGLVGHWTFDGKDTPWTSATAATTLDKSGNNNTGTLTNMSRTSSPVIGKLGQGLRFDGSNDRIVINSNPNLDPASYTISLWLKISGNTGSWESIIVKNNQSTYQLFADVGSNLIYLWDQGLHALASNIPLNTWFHFTLVQNGGTLYPYVNSLAQPTVSLSSSFATNGPIYIGSKENGGDAWQGLIDDVRIYNRALTASEIAQLYRLGGDKINASPTTKLTDGLVGYWTFDGKDTNWSSATAGTVADKSPVGTNTGTLTNMSRTSSPVIGKLGQGLRFDGVNDYVNAGDINAIDSVSKVTWSAWVKLNQLTTRSGVITKHGSTFAMELEWTDGTDVLIYMGSPIIYGYTTNNVVQTNKWQLWTMVFDGNLSGNNKLSFYMDGVKQNLTVDGTLPSITASNDNSVQIGNVGSGSNYLNGIVDEVRIYNRALSTDEIKQLYNMGR